MAIIRAHPAEPPYTMGGSRDFTMHFSSLGRLLHFKVLYTGIVPTSSILILLVAIVHLPYHESPNETIVFRLVRLGKGAAVHVTIAASGVGPCT